LLRIASGFGRTARNRGCAFTGTWPWGSSLAKLYERGFFMLVFEIIGGLFILLFLGPMLSGGEMVSH
jgi:hypothetical protein